MKKTIFIVLVVMQMFCDPMGVYEYVGGVQQVELWICLGPTLHIQANIPGCRINLDTLDKYMSVENGKYTQRLDSLRVTKSTGEIIFAGYSKKAKCFFHYKEKITIIGGIQQDISSDSVLVYLKIGG